MPGEIQVGIRFCRPAMCSLNCYSENVVIFVFFFLVDISWCQSCPKMKQKISRLSWSPNNMHTSRSKLCVAVQFLLFTLCGYVTLDRSTIQWWHKCFREGGVSTEDNPQSGYFSTVINNTSIAIVATVFDKDQCVTVREIETETGIPQTKVHRILTEHLFKKKVAAWWVPNSLTNVQKETHLKIM